MTDQKEYCIEAAGNCSAVMCHAFQAQVFSHKDSALLYGDGSCFNAMVGITRSKAFFLRILVLLGGWGGVCIRVRSYSIADFNLDGIA